MGGLAINGVSFNEQNRIAIAGYAANGLAIGGQVVWTPETVTPVISTWSAEDAANATQGVPITLSNENLTFQQFTSVPGGFWQTMRSTSSKASGKWYVEFLAGPSANWASNTTAMIGFANAGYVVNTGNCYLGSTIYSCGFQGGSSTISLSAGFTQLNSVTMPRIDANDVLALAIDFDAQLIWAAKNNIWASGGDPASGALATIAFVATTVGALFAAASTWSAVAGPITLQPSATSQTYAPPSGFQAWDGGSVTVVSSTWSAADASANSMTLSNGNMTAANTLNAWCTVRGSTSKTSGKLYVEFLANKAQGAGGYDVLGFANAAFNPVTYFLGNAQGGGNSCGINGPAIYIGGAGFDDNYTGAPIPITGDVWALAIDFTAGSIWIAKNNVWVNSSNPATGSLPIISFVPATVGALFPGVSMWGTNEQWTLQPTAASQTYAPPSGFSPWDGA